MPHGHIFVATSSSRLLLVYLFPLSGRSGSPTRNRSVSAFSRSPLGRACTFSFQYLPSTPCMSLRVASLSPYFLALVFPFLLFRIIYFAYVLYPPNFSIDSTASSWSPPKSFHIFSITLSHLIPARPFVIFSYAVLSTIYGWQPLFWHIFYFIKLSSQLYHVSMCLDWVQS